MQTGLHLLQLCQRKLPLPTAPGLHGRGRHLVARHDHDDRAADDYARPDHDHVCSDDHVDHTRPDVDDSNANHSHHVHVNDDHYRPNHNDHHSSADHDDADHSRPDYHDHDYLGALYPEIFRLYRKRSML